MSECKHEWVESYDGVFCYDCKSYADADFVTKLEIKLKASQAEANRINGIISHLKKEVQRFEELSLREDFNRSTRTYYKNKVECLEEVLSMLGKNKEVKR